LQEALGCDAIAMDMLSSEEITAADALFRQVLGDKELTEALLDSLHSGDLQIQTAKPLLPPQLNTDLVVTKMKERVGTVLADIGCVNNVLNGIVPPEVFSIPIKASEYRAGFELGAVNGPNPHELSDMVMVNGTVYISSAEMGTANYCRMIYGPVLHSTGAVLLPNSSAVDYSVRFTGTMEWNRVLNDIYARVALPFFFCGLVQFNEVCGQAVTRPPIENESLLANLHKYYSGATDVTVRDRYMFVCGICVQYSSTVSPDLKTALERHLFDVSTLEKGVQQAVTPSGLTDIKQRLAIILHKFQSRLEQPILTHTHALVLHDAVSSMEAIQPTLVERVIHMRGTSKCQSANLEVFCIEDIIPLTLTN
jgi:hypothetical protein